MDYEVMPLAAQTAYAQLQDAALSLELSRSSAALAGNFVSKTVKDRRYWYYAYREGGAVRQIYVGPDSKRLRQLVQREPAGNADAVRDLARACIAQRATTCLPAHLRLVRRLLDFGYFRAGGILVGTHAFLAYANLLGVRWISGERTADVDLAWAGTNVSVALPDTPKADVHDALTTFEAGFVPAALFKGKPAGTYRHKLQADFQVDILTTLTRSGDEPREIEALNVTAQPLRFMEYLLEDPTQAVLLDTLGNTAVVSLPAPARYAVHKLIVHGERKVRERTKANKDLAQARALFAYLRDQDATTLAAALKDARRRGPAWRKGVTAGLRAADIEET